MQEVFEKIIDKLWEEFLTAEKDVRQNNACAEALESIGKLYAFSRAIEIVKKEGGNYNNGWILCSEKLPEKKKYVLTCDKVGNIHVLFFDGENFCDTHWNKITECHERFYVPIAWQPLPEPYKEGE